MDAEQNLCEAIEAIAEYSMKNEEQYFFENLEQKELEDKELFTTKLKAHILYRYIQMICLGNVGKTEDMVKDYWDMWGEAEEEEEEEEEEE